MGCERALLAHSTLKPFLIYCVCLVNSFYFSFSPPLTPRAGQGLPLPLGGCFPVLMIRDESELGWGSGWRQFPLLGLPSLLPCIPRVFSVETEHY